MRKVGIQVEKQMRIYENPAACSQARAKPAILGQRTTSNENQEMAALQ